MKLTALDLPEGTKLIASVRGSSTHFTDGKEYTVNVSTPNDTDMPCKVRGDDTCWWLQYKEEEGLHFGVTTFKVKEEPAKEYLKVGNKLVASVTHEIEGAYFTDGKEYTIQHVDKATRTRLEYCVQSDKNPVWVRTEGDHFEFGSAVLTPVPSEQYLTPQEITECIINKVPLEWKREQSVTWRDVPVREQVVHFSTRNNYRKKPKTMEINGVTVPAPVEVTQHTTVWSVQLGTQKICPINTPVVGGLYWATKEDAQKVLDVILIPFENLNAN